MNSESKLPLHYGVGFVFAPSPELSSANVLQFLQRLVIPERGIQFSQTQHQGASLSLNRESPPLMVMMSALAQGAPGSSGVPGVSQLSVISAHPRGLASEFADEAAEVLEAYREVWPAPSQIIARECVVRYLFDVGDVHAFQYLWERRLHQDAASMHAFQRPILGGGLRFVIPAREGVEEPLFDVKIESFLANPKQLFVEAQAKWGTAPVPESLDPSAIIDTTTNYVDGPILEFLRLES